MARKLVLLTYNIKPGSDLEEYREFTRTIDYGKFRQNDRIQEYTNFVVTKNVQGQEWFKHFDLLYVDDFEAFDAGGKRFFGDPIIHEHAQNWVDRWGIDDPQEWAKNFNVSYCDEIWG
ncbi:hypothetical protein [Nocardioides sp. GXZ039]|uniref:hypothetical protein n=1 Tax=Nocardioides sp. GXZ039 TaxID=3136018 RepID=UPI0030F458F0